MKLQNKDFIAVERAKDTETLGHALLSFAIMIAGLVLLSYALIEWVGL